MKILVDTREQTPWGFPAEYETQKIKLDAGDYSVEGYENIIVVERKTLNDFVNTAMNSWLRFKRELEKLTEIKYPYVLIEDTIFSISNREYKSTAPAKAVFARVQQIEKIFNVKVHFCGDRPHAIKYFLDRINEHTQ